MKDVWGEFGSPAYVGLHWAKPPPYVCSCVGRLCDFLSLTSFFPSTIPFLLQFLNAIKKVMRMQPVPSDTSFCFCLPSKA